MTKGKRRRWAGILILLLTVPVLLAWLAVKWLQVIEIAHSPYQPAPFSPHRSLSKLLLWGPLLETVMLLLAAAAVARLLAKRQPGCVANALICAGVIGSAFVASHLLQVGVAALASAPMALLLSIGAAYAVHQPHAVVMARNGFALYACHALYNAAILTCGGAFR